MIISRSLYDHRIPEGKESVALSHRLLVGMKHMLPARKGRYEHDQRGLRQMEVRDQSIHKLEGIARINEDLRPAALLPEDPSSALVYLRRRLDRPAGSRPDTDHSVPVLMRPVDHIRSLLRDHIEFRVHVMMLDVVHLDRPEGAEAHMKGHMGDINTFLLNLFKKLLRKMKPRRRRSRRSLVLRIYRVVARPVLKTMVDIGRKRHFTERVQHFLKDSFILEGDHAVPVRKNVRDLTDERRSLRPSIRTSEEDSRPGPALFPRLDQRLPGIRRRAL